RGAERRHPDQAAADDQGDGHPALDLPLAVRVLEARKAGGDVADDDRLARLDELAGGIVGPAPAEPVADQAVEIRVAVAADDDELVAVELLDARTLVRHHLA